MPNVSVNLAVEIDASGSLTVFGQAPPTIPTNTLIEAQCELPTSCLYIQDYNSLFEFWEPSEALGTFTGDLAGRDGNSSASEGRDYSKFLGTLAYYLNLVLHSPFDCSGAVPFNDNEYSGNTNYTTQPDFGRLALSAYAHYLFGHVSATAAITNDDAFMTSMLKFPVDGDGYSIVGTQSSYDSNASYWTDNDSSNANLACRIVKKIVSKSAGNTGDANVNDTICGIVKQVLGQDASRAMDKDNNVVSPNKRQALRFIDGDTIYLTIKLHRPAVSVSGPGQQITTSSLENSFTGGSDYIEYTLKITLRDVIKSITPIGWVTDVTLKRSTASQRVVDTRSGYKVKLTLGKVSSYLIDNFYQLNAPVLTTNYTLFLGSNLISQAAPFFEDGIVNGGDTLLANSENTELTFVIPYINQADMSSTGIDYEFHIENERIMIGVSDTNMDITLISPYSVVVPPSP